MIYYSGSELGDRKECLWKFFIADFTGSAQPKFLKKIKAKFAHRNRVRAEEAGTSPAGAVVSNRENRRGIIKAFIVPSRSV